MRMILGTCLIVAGLVLILSVGGCVDARTQDAGNANATIDEYAKAIIDHPENAVALAQKIRLLTAANAGALAAPLPTVPPGSVTVPASTTPAPTVAP